MLMIGSLNAYTKNLKMETQFQIKRQRGELNSHKTLEEWLGDAQPEEARESGGDKQLRSIHQKLEAGGKLTAEERRYLQAKDPEAYSKLEASEREQRAFEQKLRQCKTKEEAQRLKMTYLSSSLVKVKAVEHNSAIPQQKKLEIMMEEKQRCDRLEKSSREFVRRGDYEKLPTQAEEAKAEQDARKSEAPRREESVPAAQNALSGRRTAADPTEKSQDSPRNRTEAETPEEVKVRRARANRARAARESAVSAYLNAAGPKAKPASPVLEIRV